MVVMGLITTGINLVAKFLSRGQVHEFEISDDLMVRLSVIDSVGAKLASTRDDRVESVFAPVSDRPPVTIREGCMANLDLVRQYMSRCPCHASEDEVGRVWVWNYVPTFVASSAQMSKLGGPHYNPALIDYPNSTNYRLLVLDALMIAMPFICDSRIGQIVPTNVKERSTLFVPSRGMGVFVDETPIGHRHNSGIPHDPRPGVYHNDSFGPSELPENLWKVVLMCGELNCVMCHPQHLHGFPPEFWSRELKPQRSHHPARALMIAGLKMRQRLNALGNPEHFQLTGWNSSYCPVSMIVSYRGPLFVIVTDSDDYDAVRSRGFWPLMLDLAVSGSHVLANARLWVACMAPVGTVCHITNAYPRSNWISDTSIPVVAPLEGPGCSLKNLIACSLLIAGGATSVLHDSPASRMSRFLGSYGLEEAVLARQRCAVTRRDHMFGQFSTDFSFNAAFRRPYPLVVRSLIRNQFVASRGVSRSQTMLTVKILNNWMFAVTPSVNWTGCWSMPIGKPIDKGPVNIQAVPSQVQVVPGVPDTVSGAIGAKIGVLNWFVFGSHGDVVPVLALARTLKSHGIPVSVVRTHTEAQGHEILAHAEKGELIAAAPEFIRTMATAATAPGVVFGPPEFSSVHVGVNFRPPSSIIHPADFGAGAVANFIIESVLRGWAPIISIGAYPGAQWFPRSADGVTYLRKSTVRNVNRPVDIMLAWGSSTLPKPDIPGAVEVLPGDHFSQFEKASIVVTHGGAGTVQTAAAAGARVITTTEVLDRRYRDPTNAGHGVMPGADPDSIMLSLLPVTSLTWIWAWKHSYAMFWRAIKLGVRWTIGPALWILVALSIRSIVFVLALPRIKLVFTLSFVSTIFATILHSFVGSWWAMILGPQVENLMFYVLSHTGLTYPALLLELALLAARSASSPVSWSLILSGHPFLAIPVTVVMSYFQIGSMLFAELLALLIGPSVISDDRILTDVGISWAFDNTWIPAFHTRFISGDGIQSVEGEWSNVRQEMGALYSLKYKKTVRDIPYEWRFHTSIPWSHFVDMPTISAPYSPLWNCQSSMLYAARGAWCLLGLVLIVLLPMGLFMMISMVGALIVIGIVLALMDIVPIVELIMAVAGLNESKAVARSFMHHMASRAIQTNGGWFQSSLAALVGVSTGWGDSHTILIPMALARAQNFDELNAVRMGHGNRFTAIDNHMYSVKAQMFADGLL